MARATAESIIPVERIASQIYVIREQNVMIDSDLAALYEVTTGNLNLPCDATSGGSQRTSSFNSRAMSSNLCSCKLQ
jgi:hypothetical protein